MMFVDFKWVKEMICPLPFTARNIFSEISFCGGSLEGERLCLFIMEAEAPIIICYIYIHTFFFLSKATYSNSHINSGADQHMFVALMNLILFFFFHFIQLEIILVSSSRELLQFCVVEVTSHREISWQK